MENEQIIRTTDTVGRIVLPAKWRKGLCLGEGDEVTISTRGQYIVIEKLEHRCVFCGAGNKLSRVGEKFLCQKCVSELRR